MRVGRSRCALPSREVLQASLLPMPHFGHFLKDPERLTLAPLIQFRVNSTLQLHRSTKSPKAEPTQVPTQVPGRASKVFFHECLPRTKVLPLGLSSLTFKTGS